MDVKQTAGTGGNKHVYLAEYIMSSYNNDTALSGITMRFNEDGSITVTQPSGRTSVYTCDEVSGEVKVKEV